MPPLFDTYITLADMSSCSEVGTEESLEVRDPELF
jgi:hypothetical protein